MNHIIIVAGGKGLRMGSDIPKQFLLISGKPVLMRTIERFYAYNNDLHIIVVLPHEQQDYWRQLCQEYHFTIVHTLVDGGDTRFASSKNGLAAIDDDDLGVVGIHDGVRPFVSVDVIDKCFATAKTQKAVIPVLPVTDTLRYVGGQEQGYNVVRSNFRIVQTPQVFAVNVAKKAFQQPYQSSFTDDASVVEAMGQQVCMVEGNQENIKLTTPFDLEVAKAIMAGSIS